MKETYEFSFLESEASRHLPPDLGEQAGSYGASVRIVLASPGDAHYKVVEKAHETLSQEWGSRRSAGWGIRREYTQSELEHAELFHMSYPYPPELASNQSVYDWSGCCPYPHCEAGRRQVAPLQIRINRLPKNKPIFKTLGGEWLIPGKVAELLKTKGFSGFRLDPIENDDRAPSGEPVHAPLIGDLSRYASGRDLLWRAQQAGVDLEKVSYPWIETTHPRLWRQIVEEHNDWIRFQRTAGKPKKTPVWFQLVVTSRNIPTSPPTRFGIGPFDPDMEGRHRCPHGHVSGLQLLSEVYVKRDEWDGSDFVATSNLVGSRGGLLVPEPLLLITPRVRQFFLSLKPKGLVFEVAYLV